MKLSTAYLCLSCDEIQEGAATGQCESCGSENIQSVAWLLRPAREREKWLRRINGGRRGKETITEGL